MKHNFIKVLSCVSFVLISVLLFTSCSKDDDESSSEPTIEKGNDKAPLWTPMDPKVKLLTAPLWKVIDDYDLTSSMTITCKIVSGNTAVKVAEGDMVAAFIDEKCVGVATFTKVDYYGKEFFLYINDVLEDKSTSNIVLKYYSSSWQVVYQWELPQSFCKDAILGKVDDPLKLDISESDDYPYSGISVLALPSVISDNMSDADEIGVFVGDSCRLVNGEDIYVITKAQMEKDIENILGDDHDIDVSEFIPSIIKPNTKYLWAYVPMLEPEEEVTIKYYSSRLSRIFVFDSFTLTSANMFAAFQKDELGYK